MVNNVNMGVVHIYHNKVSTAIRDIQRNGVIHSADEFTRKFKELKGNENSTFQETLIIIEGGFVNVREIENGYMKLVKL